MHLLSDERLSTQFTFIEKYQFRITLSVSDEVKVANVWVCRCSERPLAVTNVEVKKIAQRLGEKCRISSDGIPSEMLSVMVKSGTRVA
jgi:hypothetical protein